MPKKTKRAKLIAEYRRKLHVLEQSPIEKQTTHIEKQTDRASLPTYSLSQRNVSPQPASTLSLDIDEFTAIRKDLIKTLIIVFLFLCIEIALWQFLK